MILIQCMNRFLLRFSIFLLNPPFIFQSNDSGKKNAPASRGVSSNVKVAYAAIALMRADRRDSFLETVFLWKTPRVTPRCISGCAAFRAERASSTLPPSIADSTFLINVRILLRRLLLTSLKASFRRIRFFADLWLAILAPLQFSIKYETSVRTLDW